MDSYNIVGIDPGNYVGLSVFTIDITTSSILNIDTRLYILSNHLEDYNNRIDKSILLIKYIEEVNELYQPVAIGLESAFMNTKFANAVIQLSQYVNLIEYASYTHNPFIKILKYPPKYIKNRVSHGSANKDDMQAAISKIPEITRFIEPSSLTEHQVDATAIAYTLLQDIRTYPLFLYSII